MPRDEQARARQPGTRDPAQGIPGIRAAVIVAGISALGVGYWAQAGDDAAGQPAAPGVSRITEVAPEDVPAAVGTVDQTPEQLTRFKIRERCDARLAWVTLARAPGQPSGRIRLQSRHYYSPAFALTDVPIRIALPYPAPYETGRGTIAVLGTTTDAIVALTPPWHVPAQGGVHVLEVTWNPVGACPAGTK